MNWSSLSRMMVFVLGVSSITAFGASKPVLNEWFALGSGCRARSDLSGNVRMEGVPGATGAPDTFRAKFIFKDFALKENLVNSSVKKYGRECAVRLNINPPEGKKIVAIRAKTKIVTEKESGPALDILSELKLGAVSLGKVHQKLGNSLRVSMREETVDLEAGSGSKESLPQLGCGEPKIIGFDYSWIATQSGAPNKSVLVELGKEKSLVIEAQLEDCRPN